MRRKNEPIKLEYKHEIGDVLTYKETVRVRMPTSPELELEAPIEVTFNFTITRVITQVSSDGVMEIVSARESQSLNVETMPGTQSTFQQTFQQMIKRFPLSVSSGQMRRNGRHTIPEMSGDSEPAPGVPLAAPSSLMLNLSSGFPDEPLVPGATWTRSMSLPVLSWASFDPLMTSCRHTLLGFETVGGYECAIIKEEPEPFTGMIMDSPSTVTFMDRRLAFAVEAGMVIRFEGRVQIEMEGVLDVVEGGNVKELISVEHLSSEELKSLKRELKLIRGGLFYRRQEEYQKAKASFEKLIKQFPESRWRERVEVLLAQTLVSLASTFANEEQWDDVIATCQEAIRFDPDYADAHFWLGRAYRDKGLLDDAIAAFKEAIRLNPDDDNAHHQLGHVYEDKGMADDAISAFKKAIHLDPDDAEHHFCLGVAHCNQEVWDDAIRELQEAAQLDPDHAGIHFWLGFAYYYTEIFDDAICEMKEAVRLKPEDSTYHQWLGLIYSVKEMWDDALAAWKEAVRLDLDSDVVHFNLGYVYIHKEMFDEAIAELQKAVRLEPEHANAYFWLGNAYYNKGLNDDAIATFKEYICLQPDDAYAYYILGQIYEDKGMMDNAIAAWQEAWRLEPDDTDIHDNLVRVTASQG